MQQHKFSNVMQQLCAESFQHSSSLCSCISDSELRNSMRDSGSVHKLCLTTSDDVNSKVNFASHIFLHFEFAETSEHEIYAVSMVR